MDGSNSFVLQTAGSNNYVTFDNDLGTPTCAAAFVINQQNLVGGVVYGLPRSQGKVNNDYYVYANLGADVTTNSASTIATTNALGGVADVNARPGGGLSARSADGTVIRRGNPLASYDWLPVLAPAFGTTTLDLASYSTIHCATNTGAYILNLPSAATYDVGTRVQIVDAAYNAAVNNITINPNGGDTIEGAAVAQVINVNGTVLTLEIISGGTDWKIV